MLYNKFFIIYYIKTQKKLNKQKRKEKIMKENI